MTDDNLQDLTPENISAINDSLTSQPPSSDEPAVMISGMLINYSIVALVFLAAGVFIGMNVSGVNSETLT
ncbi:MAG: hypothetical protein ACPG7F_12620, partial [Aggregatilineales bacterium]